MDWEDEEMKPQERENRLIDFAVAIMDATEIGSGPRKLCVFQVRAVGGLSGFSDWSAAFVQRAA